MSAASYANRFHLGSDVPKNGASKPPNSPSAFCTTENIASMSTGDWALASQNRARFSGVLF